VEKVGVPRERQQVTSQGGEGGGTDDSDEQGGLPVGVLRIRMADYS